MKIIHYLEIENFKHFGEKQRIDLDHPSVLIGPNNCGKTTVIQAIALWSQAVKAWFDAKGKSPPKKRNAAPINRLNIVSVPVTDARYFWHDTIIRTGRKNIEFEIAAGIAHENGTTPVGMRFIHRGGDLLYCNPTKSALDHPGLIEAAANIDVRLLYPMSGLETDETILRRGRIDVLLGQGQTAQVLRNLCFLVFENDPEDWKKITSHIEKLFQITLQEPIANYRGSIDLFYTQSGIKYPPDIALAGRGLQQMLLLLAHLYCHPKSVLLIDEPDAHLEILRQRQIYILLREIAEEKGSQVILTTHSEKVMEDAIDHNLTLLLNAKAENISNLAGKEKVKNALKYFGAERYYRARKCGYILYVEGKTDIDNLRAFAKRLNHPITELIDTANIYYTQGSHPESTTIDSEMERVETRPGDKPGGNFFVLKDLIPDLRGLAILDGDNRQRDDHAEKRSGRSGLSILRWKRYEIENYFISPKLLKAFLRKVLDDQNLLESNDIKKGERILDRMILNEVFDKNDDEFETWKAMDEKSSGFLWEARTERMKISDFAERFFQELSKISTREMLTRKGEFYRLIELMEDNDIPKEVEEKLDAIHDLLKTTSTS
ncbi:AAA family ATPase [Thioalkalivibrio sp. HK1]|uniref:AAA family ATPase n=1 Tax=Thioalkalivibrio sp. HK1 TaxID=1469245 RepID=UPI000471E5A8|nr:ATP-binding protein [Thioalkalivibrio sp. HK1]